MKLHIQLKNRCLKQEKDLWEIVGNLFKTPIQNLQRHSKNRLFSVVYKTPQNLKKLSTTHFFGAKCLKGGKELKKAGFEEIIFLYDKARIFPTAIAKRPIF